jgi:hypothetical protein
VTLALFAVLALALHELPRAFAIAAQVAVAAFLAFQALAFAKLLRM